MPQACAIENYRFSRDMYSQKEWMCGGGSAGGARCRVPAGEALHALRCVIRWHPRRFVPAPRVEGLARGRAPLFAGFALVLVHVFLQQLQVALGHRGQRAVGAFDVSQLHMLGALKRDGHDLAAVEVFGKDAA